MCKLNSQPLSFGQSLAIHQPQCLEKWQIENNKLPKYTLTAFFPAWMNPLLYARRHLRRPVPQPISAGLTVEQHNDEAWQRSLELRGLLALHMNPR